MEAAGAVPRSQRGLLKVAARVVDPGAGDASMDARNLFDLELGYWRQRPNCKLRPCLHLLDLDRGSRSGAAAHRFGKLHVLQTIFEGCQLDLFHASNGVDEFFFYAPSNR